MLKSITSVFTTAAPVGVATRDLTLAIGSILAMLGVFGFLTPEQVKELTAQAPGLMTALGILMAGGVSVYRILTKSSSDKAAAAAKAIDAKLPADEAVVVKTPAGQNDIVVQPR